MWAVAHKGNKIYMILCGTVSHKSSQNIDSNNLSTKSVMRISCFYKVIFRHQIGCVGLDVMRGKKAVDLDLKTETLKGPQMGLGS